MDLCKADNQRACLLHVACLVYNISYCTVWTYLYVYEYTCMSMPFRDHELKVITERINLAERNFSTLLKDFTAFSAGLQSLQEKGMKLSRSVDMYSDKEYPSMKASLAGVSESIAAIQDFLGAQVSVCLHLKGFISLPSSLLLHVSWM